MLGNWAPTFTHPLFPLPAISIALAGYFFFFFFLKTQLKFSFSGKPSPTTILHSHSLQMVAEQLGHTSLDSSPTVLESLVKLCSLHFTARSLKAKTVLYFLIFPHLRTQGNWNEAANWCQGLIWNPFSQRSSIAGDNSIDGEITQNKGGRFAWKFVNEVQKSVVSRIQVRKSLLLPTHGLKHHEHQRKWIWGLPRIRTCKGDASVILAFPLTGWSGYGWAWERHLAFSFTPLMISDSWENCRIFSDARGHLP